MTQNNPNNSKIRLSIRLLLYIIILIVGVAMGIGGYKMTLQYLNTEVSDHTEQIEKNREVSEDNKLRVSNVEIHIGYIRADIKEIKDILKEKL